jgi:hypothetical protein
VVEVVVTGIDVVGATVVAVVVGGADDEVGEVVVLVCTVPAVQADTTTAKNTTETFTLPTLSRTGVYLTKTLRPPVERRIRSTLCPTTALGHWPTRSTEIPMWHHADWSS